jgi:membrane associated rhomboid family serine protease
MVGPYPDALDYWGAKNAAKIMQNAEWWRLVTPIFLHGYVFLQSKQTKSC